MSSKANRIVEDGLYVVSHNEGTLLVPSKRVPGDMHSTAYPKGGSPSDRDPVTLRKATCRELADQMAKIGEAVPSDDAMRPRMPWLRDGAVSVIKAGARTFGDALAEEAARRIADGLERRARRFARFAWRKAKERIASRRALREAARTPRGLPASRTVTVDASVARGGEGDPPKITLVDVLSA